MYCELYEKLCFIKEDGLWCYLDGDIMLVVDIKIGCNDECFCGSGKKYKKCYVF